MNSRALKRLRADHGALHSQDLPVNYLFHPTSSHNDDLTQLDILLAGPTHTPFAQGVWKLHLNIPPNYPEQPPTANFRTPIFHPNVDPQTLGVCVETLKRDWDSKLTLRHVLVTISCLLIQPNPDSALNAEAGALIQDDYESFARQAEMMTSIHARIPRDLQVHVAEAQNRGQDSTQDRDPREDQHAKPVEEAPVGRRRTIAKVRHARRGETSPTGPPARRRQQAPARRRQDNTFVLPTGNDDVFGLTPPPRAQAMGSIDEDGDSSMLDESEQENDAGRSPLKQDTPKPAATPRRPNGRVVPLGELILDQDTDEDLSEDLAEYPPSPRKSPTKSAQKLRQTRHHDLNVTFERPESSRDAAQRAPNRTPPNIIENTLAQDSPFFMDVTFDESLSPRKAGRGLFQTPAKRSGGLFGGSTQGPVQSGGIAKRMSPSSAQKQREEQVRQDALHARLWDLCGRDIKRWNRGDFDGEPFRRAAGRW